MRQRVDSVVQGLLDEARDFKRLKTDDHRWRKIDKIISQNATQLLLLEVPKGVSRQIKILLVRCLLSQSESRLEEAAA